MPINKKDKDNPIYSVPLNKLQDLLRIFQDNGKEPTKLRIDKEIHFLQSKTGKDAKKQG